MAEPEEWTGDIVTVDAGAVKPASQQPSTYSDQYGTTVTAPKEYDPANEVEPVEVVGKRPEGSSMKQGKPSYKMYDGDTVEDATARYEMWRKSPNVREEWTGPLELPIFKELIYIDPEDGSKTIIPRPNTYGLGALMGNPSPSVSEKLVGGMINSPRNVAELGAAGIDYGMKKVFGVNPKLTEGVNSTFAKYPSDSGWVTAGELVGGAGAVKLGVTGVKAGMKAAPKAFDWIAGKFGKGAAEAGAKTAAKEAAEAGAETAAKTGLMAAPVEATVSTAAKTVKPGVLEKGLEVVSGTAANSIKAVIRAAPMEIGAAAGLSTDSGTLAVGQNAAIPGIQEWAPIMRGVRAGADADEAERVLAARMNILTDSIVAMPFAKAVVSGVPAGVKIMWSVSVGRLAKVGSRSAQEEAVVEQILDRLASVQSGTGEATQAARRAVMQLIRDNKEVFLKGDGNLVGDVNMTLDTMSAVENALKNNDSATASQLIAEARGLRSGAINSQGGLSSLSVKLGEPSTTFEKAATDLEVARGGSEAIDAARQRVQQTGLDTVAQTDAALGKAQTDLVTAETDVLQLIKNDPTFGAQLDALSKKVGFDVYAGRNQAEGGILASVRRAYETMNETKNALYAAVQGGDVDPSGLVQLFKNVPEGAFDVAGQLTARNPIAGRFVEVARPRMVEVVDQAGKTITRRETDSEIFERMSQFIYDQNLDYGTLYRELRPALSQTADLMFSSTDPIQRAGGQALRDVVKWVDGPALDHVIAVGDADVAQAAKAAKDYYTGEFAPFWRDGKLADVADLYQSTVGRTSQEMRAAGQEVMPVTFAAEARQTLTSTLSDNRREYAGQLIDLLGRPEAGGNAKLVTDYIIGDALGAVASKLKSGATMSDVEVADVTKRLLNYGSILSERFPDEAARLTGFVDNLRNAKGNVQAMRDAVTTAEEASKVAHDSLKEGALARFFGKDGVPNPNGYAILDGMFKNPQSSDQLAQLMTMADNDPLVRDGIQAAYMRHLRERFLTTTEERGGNRAFSTRALSNADNDVSNVLEYGRIVFKDKPQAMDVFEGLLEIGGVVTRGKNAKNIAAHSPTAASTEAIRVMNRMVTASMGVLNRRAAVVRNISGTVIRKLAPPEMVYGIMDRVYTQPDEFLKIAERVTQPYRSPEAMAAREDFLRLAIRSFINQEREPGLVDELVNEAIAVERALTNDPTGAQTEEVFDIAPSGPPQPYTGEVIQQP